MKYVFCFMLVWPLLGTAQIDPVLDEWKKDPDLAHASFGFSLLNAKTGSVLAEYQSQLALVPASTLKLLSTYAALSKLGQHYRFETKFYTTGKLDPATGVLDGDLIIVGSGDPTIQSEHFAKDNLLSTDKWAKQIKEKGIKEIRGKVIADASCFDRRIPDEWIWADISNYYGSIPCGISFSDNAFTLDFSTGENNSKAKLQGLSPAYASTSISVTTDVVANGTEDKAIVYGDPFSFSKEVRGTLPPNKKHFEIKAALPDPALLCAEALCKSLVAFGVKCSPAQAVSEYVYRESGDERQFLFSHLSPYLDNIVTITNLKSVNLFSETMVKVLGKGDGQKGIEEVLHYWETRGMNLSSLSMKDGSGLSRANTLCAELLSKVLCKIYNDTENYKVFSASLPVAGRSGSMSNIGKGKFIENNMRAKTGYMERVRAYSGYLKGRSGKDLAFTLIVNNYSCSPKDMKLKIEKFLSAMEAY
ncbi:MAG TPA: D-alanyl-D-alanine carboxypeptidase/D-alanyl-D-alanine-endopeptidase [Bacteroidia bacterium]|nr:D-alanyl-D-alanine carboxypeptidase/D-alanyl-D-alanine-endopeptidase [Bacteroidia bacterium]